MSKSKLLLASIVWLLILGVGVLLWKFVLQPKKAAEREVQQKAEQEQKLRETQGSSRYKMEINLGIDSFSGYAILRSEAFDNELKQRGIRLNIVDDQADYPRRLSDLETGKLQMAVFPADALIKTSDSRTFPPATIVGLIDETNGADAVVAYRSKFPSLDSINNAETRFVLVGDSPSETLARVIMHDFDSSRMAKDPFVRVESPEAVVEAYKAATPSSPRVYVTWEPYVSVLLANDQVGTLVDSSRFTGYIIDTLVVSRDFLLKNQPMVEEFLESYFRARYSFERQSADDGAFSQKMQKLIKMDAKQSGTTLSDAQADRLVKSIAWKNTIENFAHFGLEPGRVMHIEDMLTRIHQVLKSTGALAEKHGPMELKNLFFEGPLQSLRSRNFFPGMKDEKIREDADLPKLSEEQWSELIPVGTLRTPQLVFARGTDRLTEQSRVILDELAVNLASWPHYYLMIRGNASSVGDLEANKTLAAKRAQAALEYLSTRGIPAVRMRATGGEITGETSVTFVVGQLPF